jgi:predicted TIM-barrel fold metal-dependent hydrolase
MLWSPPEGGAENAGVNRLFAAAGNHGVPLNVLCWGSLPLVGELAARHPDTSVVIDHLGLRQPFEPPVPEQPFEELPLLLDQARHPNVSVKVSGACTMSHEPFPFDDLWEPLSRVFDAFGLDRCMWGTDWTRATALVTHAEAVAAFRDTDRLSASDKAQLMGGSLARIYGWVPARATERPDGAELT